LERLLYHLCGENSDTVADMMQSLKTNGSFTVADDVKAEIGELFYGNSCTEEETQQTIKQLFEQSGYLCDPHTAVAVNVYDKYAKQTGDCKTPVLLVSTASPYKFPAAVLDALDAKDNSVASCKTEFEMLDVLNSLTGTPVPAPILNLKTQTKRFANLTEVPDMEQFLTEKLGLN
jgi:threonine synthase